MNFFFIQDKFPKEISGSPVMFVATAPPGRLGGRRSEEARAVSVCERPA